MGKNPTRTALLVIDVQQALFSRPNPIYKANELLKNINFLIERARAARAPVIFVQHANNFLLKEESDGWRLHPQLHPFEEDMMIRKRHGSSFKGTELEKMLDGKEVGGVVITGLVTDGCVRATCLDAVKLGYRVVLAGDAHSNNGRNAGGVVEEWNGKFAGSGAEVKTAKEINFS
jgi:nicotinamidase-related amidase